MGRPGRKRKHGAREGSGRPKRRRKAELVEERVRIARAQPHRRGLKSADRVSELAESALGRLRLRGLISEAQCAAGALFAAAVNRYRAVIDAPRPVRSLALATAYDYPAEAAKRDGARFDCAAAHAEPAALAAGGTTLYRFPCQRPGAICGCAERRAHYMRAYEAAAAAGRRALVAVIAVAVRGEEPAAAELPALAAGLQALARRFGLR